MVSILKKRALEKLKNSVSPVFLITEPYIEITGDREFVFTGKTEITELCETVLKIKSDEHRVFVFGKNLEIIYYTFEGIKINGEIEKIEFKKGG